MLVNLPEHVLGQRIATPDPGLVQARTERRHVHVLLRERVPGMRRGPQQRQQRSRQRIIHRHVQVALGHRRDRSFAAQKFRERRRRLIAAHQHCDFQPARQCLGLLQNLQRLRKAPGLVIRMTQFRPAPELWLRADMCPPLARPRCSCRRRHAHRQRCGVTKYPIHHRDHRRPRAIRCIQPSFVDGPGCRGVVAIENFAKQPRIPAPPRKNRLLHIAHIEQTAPPFRVLHRLVDQILQYTPLRVTRVLKFVQQPVVKLRVEPPVDQQPRVAPDSARQHRHLPVGAGQQQTQHIRKRQPPRAPHRLVIIDLVAAQDGKQAARPLQTPPEFGTRDPGDQVNQRGPRPRPQRHFFPLDHQLHALRTGVELVPNLEAVPHQIFHRARQGRTR